MKEKEYFLYDTLRNNYDVLRYSFFMLDETSDPDETSRRISAIQEMDLDRGTERLLFTEFKRLKLAGLNLMICRAALKYFAEGGTA